MNGKFANYERNVSSRIDMYLALVEKRIASGIEVALPTNIAYKWVDSNFQPRHRNKSGSFNCYTVGVRHFVNGPPILCKHGLHACRAPDETLKYWIPQAGDKLLKVMVYGNIVEETMDKLACTKMFVIKVVLNMNTKLTDEDLDKVFSQCMPDGWIKYSDGSMAHYQNGLLHHSILPAVIRKTGLQWYKWGELIKDEPIVVENMPVSPMTNPYKGMLPPILPGSSNVSSGGSLVIFGSDASTSSTVSELSKSSRSGYTNACKNTRPW